MKKQLTFNQLYKRVFYVDMSNRIPSLFQSSSCINTLLNNLRKDVWCIGLRASIMEESNSTSEWLETSGYKKGAIDNMCF